MHWRPTTRELADRWRANRERKANARRGRVTAPCSLRRWEVERGATRMATGAARVVPNGSMQVQWPASPGMSQLELPVTDGHSHNHSRRPRNSLWNRLRPKSNGRSQVRGNRIASPLPAGQRAFRPAPRLERWYPPPPLPCPPTPSQRQFHSGSARGLPACGSASLGGAWPQDNRPEARVTTYQALSARSGPLAPPKTGNPPFGGFLAQTQLLSCRPDRQPRN